MTMPVTSARVDEVCAALRVAGAGWADIARRLPEFVKLSHGISMGAGHHRPWVLLDGQHEDFEGVPVRLVKFENGVWAMKGTYAREIERRGYETGEDRTR